jgi:hypothetical protein
LKINLRTGIKICKQPFIINAGMLSIPTDFEGRKRLMALQMSESETGAKNKESED